MKARNAISIAATLMASSSAVRGAGRGRVDDVGVLPLDRDLDLAAGLRLLGLRTENFERYRPHGAAITLVVRIATGSAPSVM